MKKPLKDNLSGAQPALTTVTGLLVYFYTLFFTLRQVLYK